MSSDLHDQPQEDTPFPDLASLVNAELLTVLDRVLLELEQRLLRYAQAGAEILEMANEGLVLAARAAVRLAQAHSSAEHALGHLQIVGVGDWSPAAPSRSGATIHGWSAASEGRSSPRRRRRVFRLVIRSQTVSVPDEQGQGKGCGFCRTLVRFTAENELLNISNGLLGPGR